MTRRLHRDSCYIHSKIVGYPRTVGEKLVGYLQQSEDHGPCRGSFFPMMKHGDWKTSLMYTVTPPTGGCRYNSVMVRRVRVRKQFRAGPSHSTGPVDVPTSRSTHE